MNYIVTWFYKENEALKSNYTQVHADSTSSKFQDVYWKCVVSFFHASIKNNPKTKHVFYTNSLDFPIINGFNTLNFFEENEIKVIHKELSIKTEEDWHGAWRNQFYVFDIIKDVTDYATDNDNILILDSDCIINRNLDNLFVDVQEHGAIVYEYGYSVNHTINGISPNQMRDLYYEFYNHRENVKYYGGEFIAVNGKILDLIMNEFSNLWNKNFKKYEQGQPKLNEEAHFLSFIYHRLKTVNPLGNKYIKRLWNGTGFHNIEEKDINLPIYHLPAQKITGFNYYFRYAILNKRECDLQKLTEIFSISSEKSNYRKIKEFSSKIAFRIK